MRHIALIVLLFFSISCQKSADPFENGSEMYDFNAYQIPGCAGPQSFFRNGIVANNCFSYTFKDTLKIELCVSANCCPDSSRFTYDSKIENNTISFIVADTAANLCRCLCDYRIHADFSGLTDDVYTFNCQYGDDLLFTETVSKE